MRRPGLRVALGSSAAGRAIRAAGNAADLAWDRGGSARAEVGGSGVGEAASGEAAREEAVVGKHVEGTDGGEHGDGGAEAE